MVHMAGPETKVHFKSMPNFRQVYQRTSEKSQIKKPCMLYRSSRPDFLTVNEADQFKSLGIRTIIDFRSAHEYRKANGAKILDDDYPVFKVKLPFRLRYKPNDTVQFKRITLNSSSDKKLDNLGRQHILVDFFKLNYIWAVFTRAPWYIRLYSFIHLIVDVVFNTHFKHFVRLFARNVLNPMGLASQYIDMVNYSQAPICAGECYAHFYNIMPHSISVNDIIDISGQQNIYVITRHLQELSCLHPDIHQTPVAG